MAAYDTKVYCTHKYSTRTASGYCWHGRRHTWDFNQATYLGGGHQSSPICAVLVGYYSRSLYYSDCDYGWVNTGFHLNLYTYMDAGVYNADGHSVSGAGIYSG